MKNYRNYKYTTGRKGQFQQVLAFIMLAALVTAFIIFSKVVNLPLLTQSLEQTTEFKEVEDLRAGANALFFSTEGVSGKSVIELVGIAAYHGVDELNFGPVVGKVNVKRDIEAKMDAMFGRDSLGRAKWYINIPIPPRTADIQVAIVADTSASLCDDLHNLKTMVPELLRKIMKSGRKVDMTVYMLPGGQECFLVNGSICQKLAPNIFNQSDNFRALSLLKLKCDELGFHIPNSLDGNEMWAHGIACVSVRGPLGGWRKGAAKIVLPISDELPGGSEVDACGGPRGTLASRRQNLEMGKKFAKENNITVFALMADGCPDLRRCDNGRPGGVEPMAGSIQCSCKPRVRDFMTDISEATGGKMFELDKTSNAAEKIEEILSNVDTERLPAIEAGTKLHIPKSENKRIHAFTFRVPVAFSGEFTTAEVYKWS
ncbi:MAG: hypothetical protein HYX24_00680 [Candidatus Aenigmarchaeota archaeon]|nr:hypothetical protein [Candidatus Aenigmarchaeota archaeon]